MHILVVEDEKVLCETIVRSLRRRDYSVDFCYDGNHAIKLLDVESYDLVLLDLNLPGADGMTVLRKLRLRKRALSHYRPFRKHYLIAHSFSSVSFVPHIFGGDYRAYGYHSTTARILQAFGAFGLTEPFCALCRSTWAFVRHFGCSCPTYSKRGTFLPPTSTSSSHIRAGLTQSPRSP